jgi:predicted esterase
MADPTTPAPSAALHDAARTMVVGAPLDRAQAAVILLHGRGGSAEDIASLARILAADRLCFLVPEAAGHTWYPQRFIAPLAANEPWLGSALAVVGALVARVAAAGIDAKRTAIAGFSQGACLALEFAARTPTRYGAVIGLSGGLIGPPGEPRPPVAQGASLAGTPVFLGCGDRDGHIPVDAVEASASALIALGGSVDLRLYPGMGHTINEDEIAAARGLLSGLR